MSITEMYVIGEVLKLPDSKERRDLEWCAVTAEFTPNVLEKRAINIAVQLAVNLMLEKQKG